MSDRLRISAPVRHALASGRAVVAMETSFLAHGLPSPANLESAHAMCEAVRAAGAEPAPIAVRGGAIEVGLDAEALAGLPGTPRVATASRRDLGVLVGRGAAGATTVAAALACAHAAGIRVLATGGIGGVHRGSELTWDVSADLGELGRTPVAVVCSGAKSILDLPRTMEVLETEGVPVVGYRTRRLPGFHCVETQIGLEHWADDAREAAAILRAHLALGGAGIVFANPVPAAAAIDPERLEAWIERAGTEAREAGVTGKAHTPYLLARLADLSGGETLRANAALLASNAGVGAAIAVAYAELED